MNLYLVRHGQTAWNVAKKGQGHADIPLDEVGLMQAAALGVACRNLSFDRVLTSDLQRAHQTATAISQLSGHELEVFPELRERNFGEWEGMPYHEIGINIGFAADFNNMDRDEVAPPKGESFLDVWNRLEPVCAAIIAAKKDTLIVSHGGTCSLLLAMLMGGGIGLAKGFRFSNACINELEPRPDGGFRLVRYNDISHLTGIEVIERVGGMAR